MKVLKKVERSRDILKKGCSAAKSFSPKQKHSQAEIRRIIALYDELSSRLAEFYAIKPRQVDCDILVDIEEPSRHDGLGVQSVFNN